MKTKSNQTVLKDKWIFVIICPLIAIAAVHIGNENSLQELVAIPSYYSDLLLSFGCTFLATYYIKWLFKRKFFYVKWKNKDYLSLLLLGILSPTLVIIFIEVLYLEFLLDISFSESTILFLELPLILTFCLLISLFYINITSSAQKKQLEVNLSMQQESIKIEERVKNFTFLVNKGAQALVIHPVEVAYIFVDAKSLFIVTIDGKSHLYNSTLDKIENELDPSLFIRLNRKVIAQKNAIDSFERMESRKLKIKLIPESNQPYYVSKTNASKFQSWMERN